MPRPADPELRERLLAAATAEFAAAGYAGATLDAIAARASVTKGGLYFHFAGKEELFFAAIDHWRERRRRLLRVPVAGAEPAVVTLRAFLAGYLAFHFAEPDAVRLQRVLATELRSGFTSLLREDDRQERRWLRAQLRELLVLGVQDGSLSCADPAQAAFLLAAAVIGVLEQWQSAVADVEAHCHEERLAAALVAPFVVGAAADRDGRHGASVFRDLPEA
ncbi:MAG: TetR/AcrR family transcriptional regulator [Planctomycetes bacterium]|nr:TetR/AcrR family transcriptional regulator [Planctomycetota bacterium]